MRCAVVGVRPADNQGKRLLFQYKGGKGSILFLTVANPVGKPPYQFEQCTYNQDCNNIIRFVQLALPGFDGIRNPAKGQFLAGHIITLAGKVISVSVFLLVLGTRI